MTITGVRRFQDADIARMTPATVTRHIDGDTFVVHIDSPPPGPETTETVRLLGVDTPELRRGEPLSTEALSYLQSRIGADPIYLAFDFRRRDRFDLALHRARR